MDSGAHPDRSTSSALSLTLSLGLAVRRHVGVAPRLSLRASPRRAARALAHQLPLPRPRIGREYLPTPGESVLVRALTRRALFDRVERGALRPLPAEAFEVGTWKKVRVHFDYHVELDHHFYSVSHLLVGAELWGRVTPGTVEIFRDRERVTAHARSYVPGRHTTRDEHMPEAHRQHASWTPARLVSWAETNVGPIAGELCAAMLENRHHPQQGIGRVSELSASQNDMLAVAWKPPAPRR